MEVSPYLMPECGCIIPLLSQKQIDNIHPGFRWCFSGTQNLILLPPALYGSVTLA